MGAKYSHRRPDDCRPIAQGDGASLVPLTRGEFAVIDTADEHLVDGMLWYARPHANGSGFYARGKYPGEKSPYVYMHRRLLCFPVDHVDHRDGDGLNNRRRNLRIATASQNMGNTQRINGASRYKGVSRSSSAVNPWRASICCDNQRCEIGIFATEEAAALAYDEKARELFGDFAHVNGLRPADVKQGRVVRKYANGFKGVRKEHGRFLASVQRYIDGERHEWRVGLYDTPLEAALAHDAKAIELFGDDAKTNASLGLLPPLTTEAVA